MVRHAAAVPFGAGTHHRPDVRRAGASDPEFRRYNGSHEASQRTLSALEENQRRRAKLRRRRRLWDVLLIVLAIGLFAWGIMQSAIFCVVGYLVLLSTPLLRRPATPARTPKFRRRRRYASTLEQVGDCGRRHCRRHRGEP